MAGLETVFVQVIRSLAKGEQTKAKFLTYLDPVFSSFALVDRQIMISYIDKAVSQVMWLAMQILERLYVKLSSHCLVIGTLRFTD